MWKYPYSGFHVSFRGLLGLRPLAKGVFRGVIGSKWQPPRCFFCWAEMKCRVILDGVNAEIGSHVFEYFTSDSAKPDNLTKLLGVTYLV